MKNAPRTNLSTMNTRKFPIYKMRIVENDSEEIEVNAIALVDSPAIEIDWQKFSKHQRFSADEERRLVMGVFMVADMPIYRRDEKLGEYYVLFEKEEIYKIVQKFFRKGFVSNFNLMHDPEKKLDKVYLIESFIIDSTRGIVPPKAFEGISDGSWLGTVKIDNEKVWQNFIKTGELKAFSIEGNFNYEPFEENVDEKVLKEIAEIVKGN